MTKFTPVENHNGLLVKREDLYAYPNGSNGSKLRAAEQLLGAAYKSGYRKVITAAACVSPQHALVSSAAVALGMTTTHILGGTTAVSSLRHSSVRIAANNNAEFRFIKVGYNPALVASARQYVKDHDDTYWLHYGIAAPPESSAEELLAFHEPSAYQTRNIPESVVDIVLPFGSGNTGAGVLLGLLNQGFDGRVHMVSIGPDRRAWLNKRFRDMGYDWDFPFTIDWRPLHPHFATYGDRMPETLDDIVLHPTYEGKVVRFLNRFSPSWWDEPDEKTLLWVVGSALPRLEGSTS